MPSLSRICCKCSLHFCKRDKQPGLQNVYFVICYNSCSDNKHWFVAHRSHFSIRVSDGIQFTRFPWRSHIVSTGFWRTNGIHGLKAFEGGHKNKIHKTSVQLDDASVSRKAFRGTDSFEVHWVQQNSDSRSGHWHCGLILFRWMTKKLVWGQSRLL